MKHKFLILTLILMILCFVGIQNAYPDFGGFSGNSDYGGGGSSHSSSSHSSSSRSYSKSYSSSSGDDFSFTECVGGSLAIAFFTGIYYFFKFLWNMFKAVLWWIFAGIVYLFTGKKPERKQTQTPVAINRNQPTRKLKSMDKYLNLDPEFDEERIKTMLSNLYVQMQETWHNKDISSLRPYMTDSFYSQMDRQLEEFRKTHRTDYTERIAVLDVSLKGWRQSAGRDYITVGLTSRIVSYILDDVTGKLISGDKNREKFMEYEIELSRKSGVITQAETSGAKSATCPHCGAPIKLNASAKCEYCGSVITNVNTDWAICGMKGISQRTV
ncbi:MAG: TIM44-like domain-containing protein [Synergistaceae bacterium]|nr:TIM44-like domain-containing protein [Synergistaceae bacterium]MBQ6738562.1 TIM44-like domain-containing protein [Synergistaceae bacterium]MBR0080255.1 TIM44-like domain-containing protein [Synergistaceae bacterium]